MRTYRGQGNLNIVPDFEGLLDNRALDRRGLYARDQVLYPEAQDVARRKVFYVSGFDPLGARRYRELYRTEGPLQGDVVGYELDVKGSLGSRVAIMPGRCATATAPSKRKRISSSWVGTISFAIRSGRPWDMSIR